MRNINITILMVLLSLITLMSSCSTILSGRKAKVTIEGSTSDFRENVTIQTDVKTYSNMYLPTVVKVKRKSVPSTIKITSDNYDYSSVVVTKKINPAFWCNILLGGFIGMGIDAGTGAMYKPREKIYTAQMTPKQQAAVTVNTPAYATSNKKDRNVITINPPQAKTDISSPVLDDDTSFNVVPPAATISDVDNDIPNVAINNTYTYVVIIANEDYQSEAKVPFAKNDGRIFAKYCNQVLGVPQENIDVFENASYNNIRKAINNAKMFADAAGKKAHIIFYYAGHGIPNETTQSAYLLPVDGYGSDVTTGYKLDNLYADLGNISVSSVTIFIDACFSGSKRDGDKLASARGIAIKVKPSMPLGNTVVFTASSGDETAYHYPNQSHGLFTYFLLKKLKETKGDVTYYELYSYIQDNVKMTSFQNYRKIQTPTVKTSIQMNNSWETMKINETK